MKNLITNETVKFILQLVATAAAALIVFGVILCPVVVSGSSMVPTLHDGQFFFANRLDKNPDYGDIVIVKSHAGIIIKRVIGKPGDTVEIDYEAHTVSVNGEILNEDYIAEEMQDPAGEGTYTYSVEADHYFVMGDNRNNSADSRYEEIGQIDRDNIIAVMF